MWNDQIVRTMISPGHSGASGSSHRWLVVTASMPPQVGAGGWLPRPMKFRLELVNTAPPSVIEVVTAIVGRTLRPTCRRMIHHREAPSRAADSTYWVRLKASASARTMRKKRGAIRNPIAMTSAAGPFENSPPTATAKITVGSVSSASTVRRAANADQRPSRAEAMPGSTPSRAPRATIATALRIVSRVPATSRLRVSRPR